MYRAYEGIPKADHRTVDRTAAVRDIARENGHAPNAIKQYQGPSQALRPIDVELMSYPVWNDNKQRVEVYARTTPGDPTTAVWINANHIS